jgi:hypothetical protein
LLIDRQITCGGNGNIMVTCFNQNMSVYDLTFFNTSHILLGAFFTGLQPQESFLDLNHPATDVSNFHFFFSKYNTNLQECMQYADSQIENCIILTMELVSLYEC